MKFNIRLLYLYLFSFVGLIIAVIGSIRILELGLKVYVFKDADKYQYVSPIKIDPENSKISTEEAKMQELQQKEAQDLENTRAREREVAGALAMILVGFPLYKFHWNIIQKEGKREAKS